MSGLYREKLSKQHSYNIYRSGFKNVKAANVEFKPTFGGFQL